MLNLWHKPIASRQTTPKSGWKSIVICIQFKTKQAKAQG